MVRLASYADIDGAGAAAERLAKVACVFVGLGS